MKHLYGKVELLSQNPHTFQEHPNYTLLLVGCFKQALKSWMGALSTQLLVLNQNKHKKPISSASWLLFPHHTDLLGRKLNNCSWSNNTPRQKLCFPTAITTPKPQSLGWHRKSLRKISKQKTYLRNTSVALSLPLPLWWISAPTSHWAIVYKRTDGPIQTCLWEKVQEHQDFGQCHTRENRSL